MRRLLGSLLVLAFPLALMGCGEEPDERADDPATQSQSDDRPDDPATQSQTDQADPQVVDIVSGTAAGGDVAQVATVIEDDRDLERYLRQFESPFVGDLTDAIDAHPLADDRVLGLAVIEISCDEPPSATVTFDGEAYAVTPGKVVSPHPECFAPVTSVAVLDLPRR